MKFKKKMSWKEFKLLIKKLRHESDKLTNEAGTQIWCEFQFPIPSNRNSVMLINPYAVNLKTGSYHGKDLASNTFKTINIKEQVEVIEG